MLHANTLRTLFGYFKTKLGWSKTSQNVHEIYNFVPISEQLATSGQPRADQFILIQKLGYQTVINLAPADAENALGNESAIVNALAIDYIHIPVDFKAPCQRDFEKFCEAISQTSIEKSGCTVPPTCVYQRLSSNTGGIF